MGSSASKKQDNSSAPYYERVCSRSCSRGKSAESEQKVNLGAVGCSVRVRGPSPVSKVYQRLRSRSKSSTPSSATNPNAVRIPKRRAVKKKAANGGVRKADGESNAVLVSKLNVVGEKCKQKFIPEWQAHEEERRAIEIKANAMKEGNHSGGRPESFYETMDDGHANDQDDK